MDFVTGLVRRSSLERGHWEIRKSSYLVLSAFSVGIKWTIVGHDCSVSGYYRIVPSVMLDLDE